MSKPNAIEIHGLTRQFGEFKAVDNIDLQVPANSIFGFLGPNGCGKSTCMRLITGLLEPTLGEIDVLGLSIPKDTERLRRRIGYMTQKFSLYDDLTVEENLQFMATIYNLDKSLRAARIESQLLDYGLDERRNRLAGKLSGGQRQRLALAAATIHQPELLVLDEPTSAVDPENRRDFWEKLFDLCDKGATILVSTHYMDEAERCHNIAIMEAGQICLQGAPSQLMQNLGAQVVEIDGDNLRQLKQFLTFKPNIVSMAQLGTHLRVLVDANVADPVEWLKNTFTDAMANRHLQQVRASLEDVFVHSTGSHRQ